MGEDISVLFVSWVTLISLALCAVTVLSVDATDTLQGSVTTLFGFGEGLLCALLILHIFHGMRR